MMRHKAANPTLNEPQREVLRRICAGFALKEIARDTNRSVKTVEYHWSNIKRVTGANCYVTAAMWAVREGIVAIPTK
jgi:DNA-binding NarL/FixJ family response regulator